METIDEEITKGALDFMDKAHKDGKPFFVWWNSTRMHIFTHLKPASEGKTGLGIYADGMVEHDGMVGQLLDKLKELGIEDNTIVMYSTDNGAEIYELARRRHDDVPRREEHAMGRRLSRARASSAGPASSSPARSSTTSARTRTCSRRCWPRPATPPSRKTC